MQMGRRKIHNKRTNISDGIQILPQMFLYLCYLVGRHFLKLLPGLDNSFLSKIWHFDKCLPTKSWLTISRLNFPVSFNSVENNGRVGYHPLWFFTFLLFPGSLGRNDISYKLQFHLPHHLKRKVSNSNLARRNYVSFKLTLQNKSAQPPMYYPSNKLVETCLNQHWGRWCQSFVFVVCCLLCERRNVLQTQTKWFHLTRET